MELLGATIDIIDIINDFQWFLGQATFGLNDWSNWSNVGMVT